MKARQPIKKLALGSLMIALAALLMLLTGCSSSARHCYLCGGFRYERPCIIELSTGNVVELKPASEGNAELTSIGKISVRSYEQNSVTAAVPAIGDKIDRNKYCDNCLGIIDQTLNEGYVLADLNDLDNIALYEIKDGTELQIRDCDITIHEDQNNQLVLETAFLK